VLALQPSRGTRHWYESEPAAYLALATLLASVALYSDTMRYPGIYSLPPCLATAILIACGGQPSTRTTRLLAFQPLVFLGRTSYSLYLWHLPVFAFFVYYNIDDPTAGQSAALLGLILVLAIASWRYVEQPSRSRRVLAADSQFMLVAAMSVMVLCTAGFAFRQLGGLPQRFPPGLQLLLKSAHDPEAIYRKCMSIPLEAIRRGELCSTGVTDTAAHRVVVWGDSHAVALLPAYALLAASHGLQFEFAGHGACLPLPGVSYNWRVQPRRTGCTDFNEAMLQRIMRIKPGIVVVTGYWNLGAESLAPPPQNDREGDSAISVGIRSLIKRLPADVSVCVLLDVPRLLTNPPYGLALAYRKGLRESELGLSRLEALQQQATVERQLRILAGRDNVIYADLKDALCASAFCRVIVDGRSLYSDNNHLSATGARFVAGAIEPCLATFKRT
jgi:hypothetical protein